MSNAGAFFISLLAIFCFTLVIVLGYVFINAVTVVAGDPVINLASARNNQNQTDQRRSLAINLARVLWSRLPHSQSMS